MSADGKFGDYGGQYVPEALMPAIEELTDAYERYVLDNEDGFMDDFRARLRDFGGRPTPLQRADRLSERYDREVYLKREDLLHGGAHKLNNALGQVLLAKYMGKERIIAETGAGQHGTATAMACAHLDMPCEIYMGERDINRQRPNVFRMKLNGSEVNPVTVGRGTLKEAISETMRDWATNVEDTHYVIGSVVGPHPFPSMVRDFQSVISEEARTQAREKLGRLPDAVVACAGGGSNTMGAFAEFVDDEETALYAVEAGGSTLEVDEEAGVAPNSASLTTGSEGILHGARTRLLQDRDGQIMESHSVSSGLDYAGVGPELAHLVDTGRVTAVNVDDDAALTAFHRLSQMEGIIPALESAHAFGYLESVVGPDAPDAENADDLGEYVVVNVSGRGDKDLESAIEETYERDIDIAPNMDEFTGGL
ncbi:MULTISPECIES: tryptophan synthase subunit beta [Haloferax]|uniref:Tryptophan synthase beta chain n=4 Tax=Haloferax TaxID=2251 RepID=TRPB_HALVD|nr:MULTISPECIES: tryptophan synthase subunit beta [Haloferax]P18285.2 RecName: Full=Tryptophan synthase beta chain [Haloferax volcanii DS2]ADE02680.1 tryptophan synthase beta subunit [Haloferax volcanii DS2]ELY26349.1 tryptophan synthase subunit beta [Haloferax volcanii DS2]MBS8120207.1 tryptophan synthase subunit beta [Haloferax volcanii]MBS8125245.1 tryptophan synthase subunit beta [Haloferax volcanii]MBS8129113.1 tryptophan synthase subunit beta [Haloferax volcanii]